ncbi:RNA recognition motif domain-containing protein [Peredibacter sp. HCB2-198]|uniref:RNA recognition motif domain-containing protein n=1 Tax=Peredibacter sp. HCB2-198 TaxID=3383025 RepID=UPI0038B59A17
MNTSNSTVYISNLSYNRDRNGVRSLFAKFGQIKNIKIVVEPTTNQSRGMAFVEMSTVDEAKAAIAGLDQKALDGRTVKAKWATPNKNAFVQRVPAHLNQVNVKPKKQEKDLDYVARQLAKKARNEMKRKSNPLVYKTKTK